jgi:hypothetical protein
MEKNDAGKYVLKSGDTVIELTEEELYARASKGFGAEQKFEEAARIRTEAEASLAAATTKLQGEFETLLRQADAGDVTSYEKVLDMIGVTGADKFERIRAYQASEGDAPDAAAVAAANAAAAQKTTNPVPPALPATVAELATAMETQGLQVEDVVRILKNADKRDKTGIRERIYGEMKSVLDKDAELGKMISAGGSKAERLVELANQKVRGRIFDGERSGPDLYAKVLTEVKGTMKDFGSGDAPTTPPGLGPSPFVTNALSQAKETPDPKKVTDGDYAENVGLRLAHLVAEGDDEE